MQPFGPHHRCSCSASVHARRTTACGSLYWRTISNVTAFLSAGICLSFLKLSRELSRAGLRTDLRADALTALRANGCAGRRERLHMRIEPLENSPPTACDSQRPTAPHILAARVQATGPRLRELAHGCLAHGEARKDGATGGVGECGEGSVASVWCITLPVVYIAKRQYKRRSRTALIVLTRTRSYWRRASGGIHSR